MSRRRPDPLALLIAGLLLALPLATGWGNMAAPPPQGTQHAGSLAGEPLGGLRQVVIEHERLSIDLRPLARGEPARVEAEYQLDNRGPARTLPLLFVANALAGEAARVSVDGRALPSRAAPAGVLPDSWRAPAATPALGHGADPLPYAVRGERSVAFDLPLGAGRHRVRVRYRAEATAYSVNDLTPVWQLGYVLAPARDWGGFGGAEVRVELPRGWNAASNPSLAREGDALAGRWRELPADALALSLQAPEPSSGPWYLGWGVVSLALLSLCGALAGRAGAALGRRGRSAAWAMPASTGLALAWTLLSTFLYSQVLALVEWQAGPYPGEYAMRAMSYGSMLLMVLLIPVQLVIGLAVMQLCAARGRRRASVALAG